MLNKDAFDACIKKRIIKISGSIHREMVEDVKDIVARLYLYNDSPDFTVIIDSGGGDGTGAMTLHDLFKTYPGKITGIVIGQASSAAATILQGCTVRLATKNSTILIHNGERGLPVILLNNRRKLNDFLERERKFQSLKYEMLSAHTGKSIKEIKKQCDKDRSMTATEAITFGLLDGIFEGKLP